MVSRLHRLLITMVALLPCRAMADGLEMHNTAEHITGHWACAASTLIIGPDASIAVDGDWFVSAENIYIHPHARITGSGVIHLMSPATYGAAAIPTTLDGGGIAISCRLSLENGQTVTLAYLDPAVLYPQAGIVDTHPDGSDNLVMANALNFGNANAHLVLNASDLVFTADTAARFSYHDLNTVGYASDPAPANAYEAYVVSNQAVGGVITKQGLPAGGSFPFPLGQSSPLAQPYDYTPASVTNQGLSPHDFSARVTNYANSGLTVLANNGVDRAWQLSSDDSVPAMITLTHNTRTGLNIGTNGTGFDPAAAYINRYDSARGWSAHQGVSDGGAPVNILSGNYTLTRAGSSSFFSKASLTAGTPGIEVISFDAAKTPDGMAAKLFWESRSEKQGETYEVLRSADGRNFFTSVARIAARGTGAQSQSYTLLDNNPLVGDNFYCLKTIDAAGRYKLSNIRKLRFYTGDFERVAVAPNPLTPESRVIIRLREAQQVLYSLSNMTGLVVRSGSISAAAGEERYSLYNLDVLPPGGYILQLQGNTLSATLKLIKQ